MMVCHRDAPSSSLNLHLKRCDPWSEAPFIYPIKEYSLSFLLIIQSLIVIYSSPYENPYFRIIFLLFLLGKVDFFPLLLGIRVLPLHLGQQNVISLSGIILHDCGFEVLMFDLLGTYFVYYDANIIFIYFREIFLVLHLLLT